MNVEEYARCELPTLYGCFDVRVFRHPGSPNESIVISMGRDFQTSETVFVRLHSECFTGEVLGSLKCDCQGQLDLALRRIAELGRGVVLYLRQEGRGIGLGNKIRAYAEQAKGANTIEANHILGFAADLRDFRVAAPILTSLGIQRIALNTNNPQKIDALRKRGIEVVEVVPSLTEPNEHNEAYLRTKAQELGHVALALGALPPAEG
jgi:GTP cyclohydrolase II